MIYEKNTIRSITNRLRKLEADMLLVAYDLREIQAAHATELEGAAKMIETWVVGIKNLKKSC